MLAGGSSYLKGTEKDFSLFRVILMNKDRNGMECSHLPLNQRSWGEKLGDTLLFLSILMITLAGTHNITNLILKLL